MVKKVKNTLTHLYTFTQDQSGKFQAQSEPILLPITVAIHGLETTTIHTPNHQTLKKTTYEQKCLGLLFGTKYA
jgi:hypothetical protein